MELASMLADEPFSDHPASVCPVIGSLLRAYNDSIDDERRQDLYVYAAKVVGTRGSTRLERARAEHVSAWMAKPNARRWTRFLLPAALRAVSPKPPLDVLGASAVRSLSTHDPGTHAKMLALIDALVSMGDQAQSSAPTPACAQSSRHAERTLAG
jgi:hypothetical protein